MSVARQCTISDHHAYRLAALHMPSDYLLDGHLYFFLFVFRAFSTPLPASEMEPRN